MQINAMPDNPAEAAQANANREDPVEKIGKNKALWKGKYGALETSLMKRQEMTTKKNSFSIVI